MSAVAIGGTLAGFVVGFLCGLHAARRQEVRRFKRSLNANMQEVLDGALELADEIRSGKNSGR